MGGVGGVGGSDSFIDWLVDVSCMREGIRSIGNDVQLRLREACAETERVDRRGHQPDDERAPQVVRNEMRSARLLRHTEDEPRHQADVQPDTRERVAALAPDEV